MVSMIFSSLSRNVEHEACRPGNRTEQVKTAAKKQLAVVAAIVGAVRISAGCKTGRSDPYFTGGLSLAGRHLFVPPCAEAEAGFQKAVTHGRHIRDRALALLP
jgi:hypothetical protein